MKVSDTHRERLFCSIQYKNGCLAASDLFHIFTQSIIYVLYIVLPYIKEYICLKNVIHQTDSKNECLLFSASLMTKFGLAFVLMLENAFLRGFILKPTEGAQILLKRVTRYFQNSPPLKRSACFYVTISDNFETNFLENKNLFHKTVVLLFSGKH